MRSRISRNKQMSHRWKQRPPGSNWGDFGPDDQRGRMNLVTPEKVLQGVAEVQTGMRFCLSLPLDYPGGSDRQKRIPVCTSATPCSTFSGVTRFMRPRWSSGPKSPQFEPGGRCFHLCDICLFLDIRERI